MNDPHAMTCGCGCIITIHNARFTADRPTCDHCQPVIDGTDDMIEPTAMVSHYLGWCRCGNPESIDSAMIDYLDHDDTILPMPEGLAGLMLAYIADSLGWTEHGGSVYGAWITDDGREALANLKANIA